MPYVEHYYNESNNKTKIIDLQISIIDSLKKIIKLKENKEKILNEIINIEKKQQTIRSDLFCNKYVLIISHVTALIVGVIIAK